MSSDNYELFHSLYLNHLTRVVKADLQKPLDQQQYGYPVEQVPGTVEKMMPALKAGTANINSNPLRAVCRTLGIKHNIQAIKEYLA